MSKKITKNYLNKLIEEKLKLLFEEDQNTSQEDDSMEKTKQFIDDEIKILLLI